MNESVRFSLDYLQHVNYAMYVNSARIIRRLHIENHGEEEIANAELRVAFLPAIMEPVTIPIPRLPARKSVDLGDFKQELGAQHILDLTEPVKVEMTLQLNASGLEHQEVYSLTLHPYEDWSGFETLPEILAAYSMPNHPLIKNLLTRMGDHLKAMTGDGTLSGYNTMDPNVVLKQLSALFTAIREMGIRYIAPGPDFIRAGKRIRLVDEITEKGYADGMDLTILFASVLEAAGLNPLIILQEDSCLIGVWLEPSVFPESVNYDLSSLTKRIARGMNQIAVLDPVAATETGGDFNQALSAAQVRLEETDRFVLSLDLKRSRLVGIHPLPVRILEAGKYVLAPRPQADSTAVILPEELSMPGPDTGVSSAKLPRQKVWERKLLDLSLRNQLINFKEDRGLRLLVPDLEQFSLDLMSEKDFNIMHYPQDWNLASAGEQTSPLPAQDAALAVETHWKKLAFEEYRTGRIRTILDDETLDERGVKLTKGARASLEETGASSLYVGLGELCWYSRQDPDTLRKAPLILLPVDCETKGHLSGLLLRPREEEGHFNVTLTEMLKNDFGILLQGLDPLPMKGDAIDVLKVFSKVRSAIMREKKWDVKESAVLGLFSFSKFIMWSDLTQNMEEFKKSSMVSSLLSGKLEFPFEPIQRTEDFIEEERGSETVIYPVSSDSSQSLAVLAAKAGKTFVLHGPPGTGKSQTITNIIANALMQDQRVLFVAQKMAALEVVEKRLNQIGIGSFCLELHSNKARKKAVLDQLEQSMKIQRIPKNGSFEAEKTKVRNRKNDLNEIVKKMYRKDESGYSIYDLICDHSKLRDFSKTVDLQGIVPPGSRKDHETALTSLARFGVHAGGPYGHPLRGIGAIDYTPLLKETIRQAGTIELTDLQMTLGELILANADLAPTDMLQAEQLLPALQALVDLNDQNPHLMESDPSELRDALIQLRDKQSRLTDSTQRLMQKFSESFLNADPNRLERDYTQYEQKTILGKLFRKNPVEKEMTLYANQGQIAPGEILPVLSQLKEYQALRDQVRQDQGQLETRVKGDLSAASLGEIIPKLERCLTTKDTSIQRSALLNAAQQPGMKEKLQRYELALDQNRQTIRSFFELTAFEESELASYQGNYFERLSRKLTELLPALDGLRDWLMYRQAKKQADEAGLQPFAASYDQGRVSESELISMYRKSMVTTLLTQRLKNEPVLLNTTGYGLDEQAALLQNQMAELERLERKELYFHLAGQVPNLVLESVASKEIAVLQRALRSGARNLSIRNLFAETDTLLRRIAPCMLMSPMSVAQYLKPQADLFDLVVFDEASQIPTPEAIGALGRAKAAIIVGDPKQLPPTSFFLTQSNGSAEPEEFQDLDNILEDALALSMPESYLLWHYRSRHESLIAFSNRNFYDGRLYTYPSPDDMVSKVSLRTNDGIYERGGERVNRKEAVEIVDEVIRRVNDPSQARRSIGIVTFSVVQQNLIEKTLNDRMRADESLEQALQNLPEPLFIKNLENVQGDERDVILFSVGYGPDEDGRLTMNFGPLNQEGGWRRLNVAVSRSRQEMIIFTNIDPSGFQVSDTTARGVRELKAFLEFAQKGSRTLSLSDLKHQSEIENLNDQIAERLRERGWKVETSIGTSRFKVDLGLVDPRDSGRFLLGIMCGGESFREADAAYDREILQNSVLKGLGWQIRRVYAMDWLDNEVKVIDDLVKTAQDLLAAEPQESHVSPEPKNLAPVTRQTPYVPHDLKQRKLMMDDFLNVNNASTIAAELKLMIDTEGPIPRSLLAKRARALYDLSRVTPKMEKQVELILNTIRPVTTRSGDMPVYWPQNISPAEFDQYRRTLPDDTDRQLADIAPEEILAALKDGLPEPQSERSLIRQTAERLGHPQLNVDNEHLLEAVINFGILTDVLEKTSEGLIRQIMPRISNPVSEIPSERMNPDRQ